MTIGADDARTLATLTDDGTLTFATGDTVSLERNPQRHGSQIVVGSGGLLNASGTTFNATSANSARALHPDRRQLRRPVHRLGKHFRSGSLILNSGTTDTLHSDTFATQLAINSGATISITGNDFSNATVVASGNPPPPST